MIEKVRLSDVVSYSKGQQINGDELIENGKYIYLNGGVNPSGCWTDYNVEGDTITISEGGNSCGYVNYISDPFWCGAHCYYLYDSKLNNKYLYYALKSQQDKLMKLRSGACMPNIKKSDLGNFEFFISEDVGVQKDIVFTLDKITDLITKRKQQLSKLDELAKARFVEMFGNILFDNNLPLVPLKELTDIGSSKRIYANEYVESGVPFYRSKEIRELGTGLKPSVELFITQERYDEIKAKYGVPQKGDILVAAIGATIGYSWIVDTNKPFYYKDGNLIILSTKGNVNPIFLNHTMGILIDDFKSKGVAGSAQLALTIEKLEKMMVVNPPIELQNQFADFVEQTDKSKLEIQKSLDKLELLKNALMQKYFW